jgi:predicted regulator of Ras-like GTPase activity (Roadblock/LC7/MglB family)
VKQVLEPLARIPGVRLAMLVTPDGVPIFIHGERRAGRRDDKGGTGRRRSDFGISSSDDMQAWAALGSCWLRDVVRTVGPLAWNPPARVVLTAARGTLIVLQGPGAILLVVLDAGMSAEDLRLPMDGTLMRMERQHKNRDSKSENAPELDSQPTVLPARSEPRESGEVPADGTNWVSTSGNETSEVSGE